MGRIQKIFYIVVGMVLVVPLASVFSALTTTELSLIETEQEYAEKYTGGYYPDMVSKELQIHTYETICKGFYIRHETPNEVEYIGYGDLKDQYTYTEQKPPQTDISSTSPIIDTKLEESTSTPTLGL